MIIMCCTITRNVFFASSLCAKRGRACLFAAILSVLGFGRGTAAQPGDADVLRQILAQWQARQDMVKTAVWEAEGVGFRRRGVCSQVAAMQSSAFSDTGPVPAEDVRFDLQLRLWLDFEHNRARKEWVYYSCGIDLEQGRIEPRSEYVVQVYDGSACIWYYPASHNSAWRARDPNFIDAFTKVPPRPFFDPENEGVLLAHGVLAHGSGVRPPQQFRIAVDPTLLSVHAAAMHEGRECVVLRTSALRTYSDTFYEYWVDPGRDAAIVREVYYSRGRPYCTTVIQYAPFDGTWMPSAFSYAGRNDDAAQLHVKALRLNEHLDPDLFRVRAVAGMRVQTPEGVFVVDRETDVLAAQPPARSKTLGRRSLLTYALWATVIVGLCLALRFLVARLRRTVIC